jgi:3-phosphoshikimate 1-carboxyvinyltransferase
MLGLGELRVKESDRLGAMARGLKACGVDVAEGPDWLSVKGGGKPPAGGVEIAVNLDHRPAMSFLILGLAAKQPVSIDDGSPIDTSFPTFVTLMNGIGAGIRPQNP